jgi:AraC-like DNA-binding protein
VNVSLRHDGVRPDREPRWNRALNDAFPGTSVRFASGHGTSSFTMNAVGRVTVADVTSGAETVRYVPSGTWRHLVSVLVHLDGEASLEHRSARIDLAPGDLVLIDSEHPQRLDFTGPYRQVFALVPMALVGGVAAGAFGRRATRGSPVDRLLFDNVVGLAAAAPSLDAHQQPLAVEALVSLVRLSTPVVTGRPLGSRVERALRDIDERLGDPALTALAVASAQGVSRRFLDGLFTQAGTTIERMIWERRLLRAHAQLANDSTARVLEVAVGCGFSSASHFSRLFRARFGQRPSEVRPPVAARGRPR